MALILYVSSTKISLASECAHKTSGSSGRKIKGKEGRKNSLLDCQRAFVIILQYEVFLNFQMSHPHPVDLYINFVSSEHIHSSISLWSYSIFLFLLI